MMKRLRGRRPERSEYTVEYQHGLISLLDGDDVMPILSQQQYWLCELASHLSVEQIDKVHAPYTWTIRQVFEHVADAERVFGYRILRAAAGDETPVSTWDENEYARRRFGLGTFTTIVSEVGALRNANLCLLQRLVPSCWEHYATVDDQSITVRAMAWLCAGHLHHHLQIVEQRCGVSVQRLPSG
ncbi:MAG: DinB family protein [Rubripirellula sp.]|nr:DinB family protein [Rubripirellula sp.]